MKRLPLPLIMYCLVDMEEIQLFRPYQIINKQEEKEQGLKRYFDDKPCKHVHICIRYISGCCSECAKNWNAKYRRNNPEKAKEQSLKSVKTWQKKS